MTKMFNEIIDGTLEKVKKNLYKTNGQYAITINTCEELWEKIKPVILSNKELTLDENDFLDIQEYLENVNKKTSIEQQVLYQQGYFDCVNLLQQMNLLR